MSKKPVVALNSFQLTADQWLLMVPASSVVQSRDGRIYNNPGPGPIVAAFGVNGAALPIDIEHSTHLQGPKGKPAPAVGWIVELEARDNETWGRVEWTDEGGRLINGRQYRYYSPAYLLDTDDRIVGLASAGLTNKPNLRLPALNQEGGTMEKDFQAKLSAVLGLAAEASETDILAKLAEYKGKIELNSQHDLVPKADLALALNRAESAEAKLAEFTRDAFNAKRDAAINAAVAAGKIAPASKDYYKVSCNSEESLKQFEAFVATAPAVVGTTAQAPDSPPSSHVELNAEQALMAQLFGRTDDEAAVMYKGESV